MSEAWMKTMKLKLSRDEFDRLPRHPAYKYELLTGVTYITPRPHHAHAILRLEGYRAKGAAADVKLRRATENDIDALAEVLLRAFGHAQPFGSLLEDDADRAAVKALRDAFTGDDGPFVAPASFVAIEEERIVGAVLITLIPGGDPADFGSFEWPDPPSDLWAKKKGQPHLTWIFVERITQNAGVGTRLLQQAVRVLKRQGYCSLWSTFLVGNDTSLLWHWRNGFVLAENLMSKRRMRRELKRITTRRRS